jgi:nicotinamide-nucleotide amidase
MLHGEILSIGTELLLGQIIDTNASFIAERLAGLGVACFYRDTVGDNNDRLDGVLRLAANRADVIVCTGGLGPTGDDITSAAIARVFDAPLEMNEEGKRHIESFFTRFNRPLTDKQYKQALLPRGATIVPNPVGTAPGFILDKGGKTVVALPGPPHEMQPMWIDTVEPYLRRLSGEVIFSRTLRFCGIGEAALETELQDLMEGGNPTVAPYAKLAEVHIRLTAKAAGEEDAQRIIAPVEEEIRRRTGRYLYGADDETLEVVVGNLLRERGLTLAVAESCTGGLLGGRITNVPGSSHYFLGGVISYSNLLKQTMLDVPAETLREHGAVSEETARALALGIVHATGASLGISITGVAGPGGGTPEKPVGLVYLGIARKNGGAKVLRLTMWGDRATVRNRAVQQALVLLRDVLIGAEEL